MKAICLLSMFLLCGIAHARLGENESQIRLRYGNPETMQVLANGKDKSMLYTNKDFRITVEYRKGVSALEIIECRGRAFTEQEKASLMEKYADGMTWGKEQKGSRLRSDGEVTVHSSLWRMIFANKAAMEAKEKALEKPTGKF